MTTIKDVAAAAGVSISTVSRVMNRTGKVNREVEQRVLDVVRQLGYKPSSQAAGLRTRTSHSIGLVVNDIYNPFYAGLAKGIEDVCRQQGYSLILCNSGLNLQQEREYLEMLVQRSVDGVIISPCSPAGMKSIAQLVESKVAVVQVNRELKGLAIDTVVLDNFRAMFEPIQYLHGLGHNRIATIAGPDSASTGRQRREGYLTSLQILGLPLRPEYIGEGDFNEASGYRACQELLALPIPPTALVVANNQMAAGAMHAIRDAGLLLPDDLSFITVDDPAWAEFCQPTLTVVRQPVQAMGMATANQLLSRLSGSMTADPVRLVLTPQLVIRQSCGTPRAT